MNFDVQHIGGATPNPGDRPDVLRTGGPGFATVYDLSVRRTENAKPAIPDEVWDEMDTASRTAEEMERSGHTMRFDVHRVDGKVVASLVDGSGSVVRPVSLSEVLDVGSVDPDDAA
jgi:hypothetical protein